MTKIYLYIFLCFTTLQACAQTPTTTTPTAPAAPAVYASAKAGWLVDLDEAYALSLKEKKPIMANFTGSDWCGWCKRLDADVFSKPEFQTWAKANVILLEVDFPRAKIVPPKNQQQNAAMQNALKVTGYPTVWLFTMVKDDKGMYQLNQLGKTGYTASVETFVDTVDKMIHPE